MYKDFTSTAEAIRQERFRVATTRSARSVRRGLQTKVGHLLMRMGQRLVESPVARTRVETASV